MRPSSERASFGRRLASHIVSRLPILVLFVIVGVGISWARSCNEPVEIHLGR
jgi:hypothetical protein